MGGQHEKFYRCRSDTVAVRPLFAWRTNRSMSHFVTDLEQGSWYESLVVLLMTPWKRIFEKLIVVELHFMNPKVHLLVHRAVSQTRCVLVYTHPTSFRTILMSPCRLHGYVLWSLFPSGFLTKPLSTLLFLPRFILCHIYLLILIWKPYLYLARITNPEDPHYPVLPILLLLLSHPSISAVPFSGTFSVYVLLLICQIKFHTRANSRQNYNFVHYSLVLVVVVFFFQGIH